PQIPDYIPASKEELNHMNPPSLSRMPHSWLLEPLPSQQWMKKNAGRVRRESESSVSRGVEDVLVEQNMTNRTSKHKPDAGWFLGQSTNPRTRNMSDIKRQSPEARAKAKAAAMSAILGRVEKPTVIPKKLPAPRRKPFATVEDVAVTQAPVEPQAVANPTKIPPLPPPPPPPKLRQDAPAVQEEEKKPEGSPNVDTRNFSIDYLRQMFERKMREASSMIPRGE
ncbi:hypothetical protein Ciccas_002089, partial [Cichlidogyrus casuarinus]